MVALDPRDPTPIYAQLERAPRGDRDRPAAGRRPAPDGAAARRGLRVNANTVARVYAELERAGVLETGAASARSSRHAGAGPARRATRPPAARVRDARAGRAAAAGFTSRELVDRSTSTARKRSADSLASTTHAVRTSGAQRRRGRAAARRLRPAWWLAVAAGNPCRSIVGGVLGLLIAQSPQVAQQWERAVVLRLGRFVGLRGPGTVLGRAVRRQRVVLDRPADDHHELRRRADADRGHRAGERRRGALLDGARRARRRRSRCRTTRRP